MICIHTHICVFPVLFGRISGQLFTRVINQSCGYGCCCCSRLDFFFCFGFDSSWRQAASDVGPQLELDVDLSQLEAAAEIQHSRRISRIPTGLQATRRHQSRIGPGDFPQGSQHRSMCLYISISNCRILWINVNYLVVLSFQSQSHAIQGLQTFTQYMISLQVFNPEGLGPSSTVIVMTDEGGNLFFLFFSLTFPSRPTWFWNVLDRALSSSINHQPVLVGVSPLDGCTERKHQKSLSGRAGSCVLCLYCLESKGNFLG